MVQPTPSRRFVGQPYGEATPPAHHPLAIGRHALQEVAQPDKGGRLFVDEFVEPGGRRRCTAGLNGHLMSAEIGDLRAKLEPIVRDIDASRCQLVPPRKSMISPMSFADRSVISGATFQALAAFRRNGTTLARALSLSLQLSELR